MAHSSGTSIDTAYHPTAIISEAAGHNTFVQINTGGMLGGNTWFVFDSEKVGIGPGITPTERLHVVGNVKLDGNTSIGTGSNLNN